MSEINKLKFHVSIAIAACAALTILLPFIFLKMGQRYENKVKEETDNKIDQTSLEQAVNNGKNK